MKKLLSLFLFLLLSANLLAQQTVDSGVQMADSLRANGKIYVVVVVIAVVLTGLLIYLITLDRKIGRLEKELKK
jgi:CcmD family protein